MEFATLHLDTYKVVKLLQSKGYTKKEAEGFIEAIQEITLSGVATKQDVADLKEDIAEHKAATKQDIADLRAEMADLRTDVSNVRTELKEDMAKYASDNLRFQLIQTTALIAVMVALFQLF